MEFLLYWFNFYDSKYFYYWISNSFNYCSNSYRSSDYNVKILSYYLNKQEENAIFIAVSILSPVRI